MSILLKKHMPRYLLTLCLVLACILVSGVPAKAQTFYANLSAALSMSSMSADVSARALGTQLRQAGLYTNERIDYGVDEEGLAIMASLGLKVIPSLSFELGGYLNSGLHGRVSTLEFRTIETVYVYGVTLLAVFDIPLSPFFLQGGAHYSFVTGSWAVKVQDNDFTGGRNENRAGPVFGVGLKYKWAYVSMTLYEGIGETVAGTLQVSAGIRFFFI